MPELPGEGKGERIGALVYLPVMGLNSKSMEGRYEVWQTSLDFLMML